MDREEKLERVKEVLEEDHELVSYEIYSQAESENNFSETWTSNDGYLEEYILKTGQEDMERMIRIVKSNDFNYGDPYYKIDAYGYVETCNFPDFYEELSDDGLLDYTAERILDGFYKTRSIEIDEIIDAEEDED